MLEWLGRRQNAQWLAQADAEPRRDLAGFALKLLLFESVDEFHRGEKPDALAMRPILQPRCRRRASRISHVAVQGILRERRAA